MQRNSMFTNFNLGFSFLRLKVFPWIISSLLFKASDHLIVDKTNLTELAFQVSYLNTYLAVTLGYLNPDLNNQVLGKNIPLLWFVECIRKIC